MQMIDVDATNALFARAQRTIGVDPETCLRFATTPGPDLASPAEYTEMLSHGLYPTPDTAGYWSNHDVHLHKKRISEISPDMTSFLRQVGRVGQEALRSGDIGTGGKIVKEADLLLSGISGFWPNALFILSIHTGHALDRGGVQFRASLMRAQNEYADKIQSALPQPAK